jgi:hypothetical protein
MYEELAMRHLYTCSSHDNEPSSPQDPLLNDDGIRLRNEMWLKRLEEFIKVSKGNETLCKYHFNE